jgi:hypothetical protein
MFSMSSMNKRAKRITAACASAAVVTAGGVALGVSANAGVGETLSFGPTDTNATIVNVDPTAGSNAALSYGVKVTGAPAGDTDPLYVSVKSGPTSGKLYMEDVAGNGAPTAGSVTGLVTGAAAAVTADLTASATAGTSIALSGAPSPALTAGSLLRFGASSYALITQVVDPTHIKVDTDLTALGAATAVSSATTYQQVNVPVPVSGVTTPVAQRVGNYAGGDNIYLGAKDAGTYTFQFFRDRNGNGVYDSTQDEATPVFTLVSKDVRAQGDAGDDLDFNLTVPSSIEVGQAATVTASPGLSTRDTRGTDSAHGNVGALGYALAQAMTFTYAPNAPLTFSAGANTGSPTFDGTVFKRDSGVVSHFGTLTTTPSINFTGGAGSFAGQGRDTSAPDNQVTAIGLDVASLQDTNVKLAGPAATVRAGHDSVTYEATVTVPAGVAKSGRKVIFSIAGVSTIALADLTANGSAIPTNGQVAVTTDSSGKASLTIKSTKTANGNSYSVAAQSNGFKSDNNTANGAGTYDPIVAAYQDTAANSIKTPGKMLAKIGDTVTITGELRDQWNQTYKPAAGVQAKLQVKKGAAGAFTDFEHTVDIGSDGKFSSTYNDSTLTGVRTDYYQWVIGSQTWNNNDEIRWRSSVYASKIDFTALDGTATFPVPSTDDFVVADHTDTHKVTVKGVLKDDQGNPLPFTTFQLKGSDGVYFLDEQNKAVKELTLRTNAAGQISDDGTTDGVEVFFTRTGSATEITISSGSVTATTGKFDVKQLAGPAAGDAWKVDVNTVKGTAGKNITVSGKVQDAFYNPVANEPVTLQLDSAQFGAFITATNVMTDPNGNFSAVFISGDDDHGDVHYTASINGGPPNPASAAYGTTGLSLPSGQFDAHGTITVQSAQQSAGSVSIVGPKSVTGGGWAKIEGTTQPNAVVSICKETRAGLVEVKVLKADDHGHFFANVWVDTTSTFIAKLGTTAVSNEWTVLSYSTVKITGTKHAKKNRIAIIATGAPLDGGHFTLWQKVGGKYRAVVTVRVKGDNAIAFTVTPTKSRQYFGVTYQAPGSAVSSLATISVKR